MLKECFDALYNNRFGDTSFIKDYIYGLENGGDYYLACHDFDEYVKTQDKIDYEYQKNSSRYYLVIGHLIFHNNSVDK